ncbi:hypothetical protein [Absidia glauca]|uniref:Uncharacterized protein n=1 Tax=Absidia glauca TaxID=4829 RepID=A0A168T766_ABSGL|nr:hypothetical protein [Absidia glauca]
MMPKRLYLVDEVPNLGPLESAAVLGLSVGEAYSILQVWYLLINGHFMLLHVEFEEGSPIPVWRDRAARYKKASVMMDTGIRPKDSAMAMESTMDEQWASRYRRHRLRYCRRHRRSRSKCRKQNVGHGKLKD